MIIIVLAHAGRHARRLARLPAKLCKTINSQDDMWWHVVFSLHWGEEAIGDRTPHLWLNAGWWVRGSAFCCSWFRHHAVETCCEHMKPEVVTRPSRWGKAILFQASPFQGETCNQINLTKNTIHDTKTQIRPLQGTVDQASWHECGCTWSNQVMGHGAWSERKYPCNYKCRPPTSHEHASMLIMSLCFHDISLIHRIHCIQDYFHYHVPFVSLFLCVFFVPRQVFRGANGVDIYVRILAKTTRSQGAHPRSSDLSETIWKTLRIVKHAVPGCGGKALWNR